MKQTKPLALPRKKSLQPSLINSQEKVRGSAIRLLYSDFEIEYL